MAFADVRRVQEKRLIECLKKTKEEKIDKIRRQNHEQQGSIIFNNGS